MGNSHMCEALEDESGNSFETVPIMHHSFTTCALVWHMCDALCVLPHFLPPHPSYSTPHPHRFPRMEVLERLSLYGNTSILYVAMYFVITNASTNVQ